MDKTTSLHSCSLQLLKEKKKKDTGKIGTTKFKECCDQPAPQDLSLRPLNLPSPVTHCPALAQAQIQIRFSQGHLRQPLSFSVHSPGALLSPPLESMSLPATRKQNIVTKPGVSHHTGFLHQLQSGFQNHEAGLWVYIGHHLVDIRAIYFQAVQRSLKTPSQSS